MNDFGIKVSKSGYDVNVASDEDLSYSSKFKGLKILEIGTSSVTITNGNTESNEWSHAHGLNYRPAYIIYVKQDIGGNDCFVNSPMLREWSGTRGTNHWNFTPIYNGDSACAVDDTNVYFKYRLASVSSGTTTIYFTYIIFLDSIDETTSAGPALTDSVGMKISSPGSDIYSSEEYDLHFTSARKQFNVVKSGTGTVSLGTLTGVPVAKGTECDMDTETVTATIAHGLDYVPAFFVYVENVNLGDVPANTFGLSPQWKMNMSAGADITNAIFLSSYINSTNLVIRFCRAAGCVIIPDGSHGIELDACDIDYRYLIFNTDVDI